MKKQILSQVLARSGLLCLSRRALRWSGVLVLNYHRIGTADGTPLDRGLYSADRETFRDHVRFCKTHFDVIDPGELPRALGQGRGRYVLITFDDGYRDNFEAAFPVLVEERVPATFFLTTGFLDAPRLAWWDEVAWMVRNSTRPGLELPGWLDAPLPIDGPDREPAIKTLLRAYKAMPTESTGRFLDAIADAAGTGRCGEEPARGLWMTWDMVRRMRAAGMTVGGHTVNHPILARAETERQRDEIRGCGQRLAAETGEPMRYFSYPGGRPYTFDTSTRDCLREAGVRYAFSDYGGFRRPGDWDDYDVRRVPVEPFMTGPWFRSLVSLPQLFS